MPFTYPNSPAFEDVALPSPPVLKSGQQDKFIKQVDQYLNSIFLAFSDLQTSIRNGWLIKDARVVSLTADKIFANQILTQTLFIGSDKGIVLASSNNTIEIYDQQVPPKLRVKEGKLGSGTKNWGIEIYDDTGAVIFRSGTATFINGAIITNATITNSKYADGSVSPEKRSALSSQTFGATGLTVNPGVSIRTHTFNPGLGAVIPTVTKEETFTTGTGLFMITRLPVVTGSLIQLDVIIYNVGDGSFSDVNYTITLKYW